MAKDMQSGFEKHLDKQRFINDASKKRLDSLSQKHGNSRYSLKESTRAHKDSKTKLKLAKRTYQQGLREDEKVLAAQAQLSEAKGYYRDVRSRYQKNSPDSSASDLSDLVETDPQVQEAEAHLNKAKAHLIRTKRYSSGDLAEAKKALVAAEQAYQSAKQEAKDRLKPDLDEAKDEVAITRKTRHRLIKRQGGTRSQRFVKNSIHRQASQQLDALLQEDDTLSDIATWRQQFRSANRSAYQGKRLVRTGTRVSRFVLVKGYRLGNRVYNLNRGRGFTVTPTEFSWHGRMGSRYRQWKKKFIQNPSVQALKGARYLAGKAAKPFLIDLKNPLTFKAYVIMFLLAVFFAMTSMGSSIPIQDEFDLNASYLYMTQRDREKSTDKVDYWTNWEDPMLYINHHYDEMSGKLGFNDKSFMVDQHFGRVYLDGLWDDLNQNPEKLKQMADLYKDESLIYYLDKDKLEEYEELLENAKEIGKFSALQELENPFYLEEQPEYDEALVITKRFGYVDKETIFEGTVLKATAGQDVYAVMDGTVEIDGETFRLVTKDAIFTYEKLSGIRYNTGDKVKAGELIGTVSSSSGLEISYQKLNDDKVWTFVNPGFYFAKVTYTQATSVISNLTLSGDKLMRVQRFADLIKQHIPEATDEGIAAILGAFDIESGVTFKRYETDSLTGHQFDLVAQEPTAENLVGSWAAFQGLYSISLNESGYLVNGKHYIGLGIGQWTGGRAVALWEFARNNQLDLWSEEAQVRFLLEGDNPYYTKVFRDVVTSTDDTDTSTKVFLDTWLGVPGNKLAERQASARQMLGFLKRPGLSGDYSHIFNTPYKVLQPYGRTPWSMGAGAFLYPKGYHDGIDLVPVSGDFAGTDVPVFSATNGTVHTKYGTDIGGYALIIKTDFGGYLYYGHLKRLPEIAVGAEVKKGDPIAVLGSTGAMGIYHVHLQYNEFNPNPMEGDDRDPSFLIQRDGSVTQDQVITP